MAESGRSHSRVTPVGSAPTNASCEPSGERARGTVSTVSRKVRPGGGGTREADRPGRGRRGETAGAGGPRRRRPRPARPRPRGRAVLASSAQDARPRPRARAIRPRRSPRAEARRRGRSASARPDPWPGRCERAGRARAGSSAAARTSPSARPSGWPRRARLRASREGPPTSGHLVEHRSQGEDVGAGVGRLALDLLRRHVREACRAGSLPASGRTGPGRSRARPRRIRRGAE